MTFNFSPRTIRNSFVTLEPLNKNQIDEICRAMIPDPFGWYSVMFGLNTREGFLNEIKSSQQFVENKTGMGFLIRENEKGSVAGMSFFLKMDSENRHLEIGSTNMAPAFRRTAFNTATKLALLEEAFETMKCVRVSFRVDEENKISQKAVERLGAVYGGNLRHERILPDGRIRDYRFYSIIDSEWPAVKERLLKFLNTNH